MYIMKCDRCGFEQGIKSILSFFGAKEEAPTPGRKFSLMQLDEFREITLCQDCEAALGGWIEAGDRKIGDTETKVRHGHWERSEGSPYPFCSECSCESASRADRPYCQFCGAKMDGGQDDGV